MKKIMILLLTCILFVVTGCSQQASTGGKAPSTVSKILERKKLVVGTTGTYLPFNMKDMKGEFIGYDIDLARSMAKTLNVDIEIKQYKFSGLIPALQTGEIDMILTGMTIRGDRALAASFSNPYYATGQALLIQKNDQTTKSWKDLDQAGKKIAVPQGSTGALLAKQLFTKAEIQDFDNFSKAALTLSQARADAVIYDEPGIQMFEAKNEETVKGIYNLLSKENLGVAVQLNDLETVQWINSFLENYLNSPGEIASREKWFQSKDWMKEIEQSS